MQPVNKGVQYLLCAIFMVFNVLYICFFYSNGDDIKQLVLGWWPLNPWFFNHILFIVFPVFNILFWVNRKRVEWIDYSLLYMPFLIWLLFIPLLRLVVLPSSLLLGGSWSNYYIQLPAIIMTASCLYLLRFYSNKMKTNNNYPLWKEAGLLWIAILLIVFGLNLMIDYVPLLQFDYK